MLYVNPSRALVEPPYLRKYGKPIKPREIRLTRDGRTSVRMQNFIQCACASRCIILLRNQWSTSLLRKNFNKTKLEKKHLTSVVMSTNKSREPEKLREKKISEKKMAT